MKYFTVDELTNSKTAQIHNIINKPGSYQLNNLLNLGAYLDNIRERFGSPIYVTSGFRCKELNKLVGGATNSDHIFGGAVDITTRDKQQDEYLFELIQREFDYNQVIREPNWIHYSYYSPDVRHNKHQSFRKDK